MMRILSIGNSFSQDAHAMLHALAQFHGFELETVNLYIGGCSLQMHWENLQEDAQSYDLEINGEKTGEKTSIREALARDPYDVVTLQQASHFSGLPETYEPFLSGLATAVRESAPQAKIYFHETWSYETDSTHSQFGNYHCDQKEMDDAILSASKRAAARINAKIIPVGEMIAYLRKNCDVFDYLHGGRSLCRDGFHLSLDYGRYTAAAVWLRTVSGVTLQPMPLENADPKIIEIITQYVNAYACGKGEIRNEYGENICLG